MNNSPRVSIIVPVCNVAPYLPACLDSLVHQTLHDIEIICIDDCSTDGCGEILAEYAAKDSRIRIVTYETNKTAAQARKDGALMARGRYIMFIDSDDMLECDACETLAALMDEKRVDMIQFGTTVLAEAGMDGRRKANMQRMLQPYGGTLRTDRLLECCFVEKKFGYQIWNKIYRADVCQRAFACFPDGRFSKAQDVFAFFLIAFFARSYEGYMRKPFYVYRFGAGVTGRAVLDRGRIDRYADQALVPAGIRAFLEAQGGLEAHQVSLSSVTEQMFGDAMAQLRQHIADEDVAYAYRKLCKAWGAARVIAALAAQEDAQPDRWARLLCGDESLRPVPHKVRRIGTYYHDMRHGGAQRVMAELAQLWSRMGYEVVVFTDGAPSPEDYPAPASVRRVALPDFVNLSTRQAHIAALHNAVREGGIDLFIWHDWLSGSLLWDMLAVQAAGAQFYIHTHSVFSAPLLNNAQKRLMPVMQSVFSMADGVLTLSRTDAAYWQHFNPRVFIVRNPLSFDCRQLPMHELTGSRMLWVGRISKEKQPLDAVEIFARVARTVPAARLTMVGSGSERLMAQLRKRSAQLGVADRVELAGFQADVSPFYAQADILLSTSLYEGFSLTTAEAQAHGVPAVTYEMPYLTLLESGKGSVSVRQGDQQAAAEQIIALLNDRARLAGLGLEAKENVIAQCTADFDGMWREIIASAEKPRPAAQMDPYGRVAFETLLQHMESGVFAGQKRASAQTGAFVPMPTRGPFKTLRKKARTALQVMTRDGVSGFREVLAEKLFFRR